MSSVLNCHLLKLSTDLQTALAAETHLSKGQLLNEALNKKEEEEEEYFPCRDTYKVSSILMQ
jgi:hypothetical protein